LASRRTILARIARNADVLSKRFSVRFFVFELKLPDGRIVEADATAWRWTAAFSEACSKVESRYGLGPWAGIVCVAYHTTPVAAVNSLLGEDSAYGSEAA
jgi:hypothetical protein